jgi:hypothetical protein
MPTATQLSLLPELEFVSSAVHLDTRSGANSV